MNFFPTGKNLKALKGFKMIKNTILQGYCLKILKTLLDKIMI